MENLPNWLVIIMAIIGTLGGVTGILAFLKAPEEIKKTRADAYETLSNTIDTLSERVDRQNNRIDELEIEIDTLQEENDTLKRGVNRLVNQIRKEGLVPVWTPDMENGIMKNKKE